jgi:hypothetical protein
LEGCLSQPRAPAPHRRLGAIIGDLFDVPLKANLRSIALLEEHPGAPRQERA